MRTPRAVVWTLAVIPVFAAAGCRSGPIEGWSARARSMILTSGPAEIVMSSSRVPGYWAREAGSGQEFFLYTRLRSYETGSRVTVEGPFGPAAPAVFREETGLYRSRSANPVFVLVVWKIRRTDDAPHP